jgi:hypothetical protein
MGMLYGSRAQERFIPLLKLATSVLYVKGDSTVCSMLYFLQTTHPTPTSVFQNPINP